MQTAQLGEWYLTSEDGLCLPRYGVPLGPYLKECNLKPQKTSEQVVLRQQEVLQQVSSINPEQKMFSSNVTIEDKGNDISHSRDYNEAFQSAVAGIRGLNPNTRREQRLLAYGNMAHLGEDFLYTVRTYARIIISEVYLSDEKKTIKPSKSVGGIAGGDKYIVQNILFKFAVDSKNLYGGDEFAMKVAGHDLKAMTYLFNGWMKEFHFPMMALVDYRGYRMVAMTLLPLDKDSQVFGSADAGKTVHNNLEVHDLLDTLGSILNLKDHPVGKMGNLRMKTPIDLEVHEGSDSRYYVLDFSRTLPPQEPRKGRKMEYLYRHFRPEFVKNYPKPLCSDAFSPFIIPAPTVSEDKKQEIKNIHNDIREAESYLKKIIIPTFVQDLDKLPSNTTQADLVIFMHMKGINIRYLGRLLPLVLYGGEKKWAALIIIEMVSRVLKDMIRTLLREKMKQFRYPGEGVYRRQVVELLNLVTGNGEESTTLWDHEIYNRMLQKFGNKTGPISSNNVREEVYTIVKGAEFIDARNLIFLRLAELVGLRYTPAMYNQLLSGTTSLFDFQNPFDETDLKEMKENVRPMPIISHSQGFLLRMKGIMSKDTLERERLLTLSSKFFRKAVSVSPTNRVSLRNYGDVISVLNRNPMADAVYRLAIEESPDDTNTLFKYGVFLDKVGRDLEAENYYLRSLEANFKHSNVHCVYADFLAYKRGDVETAELFYQAAIATDPSNEAAGNNYAIVLTNHRKEYIKSEELFLIASTTRRGTNSPHRFLNLATFYANIKKDIQKADVQYEVYKRMYSSSLKMCTPKFNITFQDHTVHHQDGDCLILELDNDYDGYYEGSEDNSKYTYFIPTFNE